MASVIDICNLALAHLGDTAEVAALDEGSVQASLCNRFYPIARNGLLDQANWDFAMRRATLAPVTNPTTTWAYAYALPANCISLIAILPKDATDDYGVSYRDEKFTAFPGVIRPTTAYVPQPFSVEGNGSGTQIILTNTEDAVARYTAIVTDPTQFSPLFVTALSYQLASMLAGPLLKGDAGSAEAKRCLQLAQLYVAQAAAADANARKTNVQPVVNWIAGR